jgi:hypothetical protein
MTALPLNSTTDDLNQTWAVAPPRAATATAKEKAAAPAPDGCRFCGSELQTTFVDLGMSPLCESFVTAERADQMEPFYPLHALVCDRCLLVQLKEYVSAESIFDDYAYFSSFSESWLRHARKYAEEMAERFSLGAHSQVVEVASNDGYLLQNFVRLGIPALGIEPSGNVAEAALAKGVPTLVRFFGEQTARDLVAQGMKADLLLGNNVFAHVPQLNDFTAGLKLLLAESGVLTLEFPHLLSLMAGNQFDTIYHEHFSYFSFATARHVLEHHGLTVFDVTELASHGGSLRVFARHAENAALPVEPSVAQFLEVERQAHLHTLASHRGFAPRVQETKRALLEFLIDARRAGKRIAVYGAPGKGNTLLNYCGIREDFIEYAVDRNPYKHGRFTPGTRIPIYSPERLAETKPDYIVILPWNLKHEIIEQLQYARAWGAKFVVPIPALEIL